MTFHEGTKIDTYEIIELVGRGGMGEVYRARDSKLRRDVAIKVLHEGFDVGSDRASRFQREAQILASLNHPNIAIIHDFQKASGGTWFLVLELVEGETLAQRIARGAVPVRETLEIGRQITDALEAAHEKGIVHRDLKPTNIKITPEGRVKVLDFGLAKIRNPDSGAGLSDLPTQTAYLSTDAGTVLGTAPYMSPEQVRGKDIDKRSDIWAFGAVLFEMLTGRAAFRGGTVSDIIAAVLSHEVDWNALSPVTPPGLRDLLRRCLERDSHRRLRDIGDARIEIDELLTQGAAPAAQVPSRPKSRRAFLALVALALVLSGVLLGSVSWLQPDAPASWTGNLVGGSNVALTPRISPDGKSLAFLALVDGISQVGVVNPKSGNWTLLTKDRTRGYVGTFSWSLDGTRIYYTRMQGIPRGVFSVPALGGDERLVVENAKGGEPLPDGSLVVSRVVNRQTQIHRYWPANGRVETLPGIIPGERDFFPVRLLPDGSGAVFWGRSVNEVATAENRFHLLNFSTGRTTAIPFGDLASQNFPFALTPDGKSVLILTPNGDRFRILAIDVNGAAKPQTVLDLQEEVWGFDVGTDGSLYVDQIRRPADILRFTTSGKEFERVSAVPNVTVLGLSLYLADGRTLVPAVIGGRRRLLMAAPGKDAVPFIETDEETAPPSILFDKDRVAFLIGTGSGRRIAIASLEDGRILRQVENVRVDPNRPTMAMSPDGTTLYFTNAGAVWSVAIEQPGEPRKIHAGDGVAITPDGKKLIISLLEAPVRWAIVSLETGREQPIRVSGDFSLTPLPPAPGSVARDGRILLPIAVSNSWFYSPALFNPATGSVQRIPVPYVGDFFDLGWTPDGKVVAVGYPFESAIWKFTLSK